MLILYISEMLVQTIKPWQSLHILNTMKLAWSTAVQGIQHSRDNGEHVCQADGDFAATQCTRVAGLL